MQPETSWLILTATLPTHPSALRVRVWRALKASGTGTLREGVYVLPATAPVAPALWDLARTIQDQGGDAHMLEVTARDEAQAQTFRSLFDRTAHYTELLQTIKATHATITSTTEAALHKTLRQLAQQLDALQAQDFFPGDTSGRATAALQALRQEVAQHFSPGEPVAQTASLVPVNAADFQGKTWATRKRPWIDRLATAWLVRRFIDPAAKFVWLADAKKCPKSAIGFDFDNARFSHVGDKVTFEVVAHSFGLDADRGLLHLGALVHYIDVGGIPLDEAPGLEAIVRGLQTQHPKDDALLIAACAIFDALYLTFKERP